MLSRQKSQLCDNIIANSGLTLLEHTHISYIAIAIGIKPCMIPTHTHILSSHTYTPLTVIIPNRRHGSRDNDQQQHLHVDYYLQQVKARELNGNLMVLAEYIHA